MVAKLQLAGVDISFLQLASPLSSYLLCVTMLLKVQSRALYGYYKPMLSIKGADTHEKKE